MTGNLDGNWTFNPVRFAKLREAKKLSQRELAITAGVTASFVSSVEGGYSQNPGSRDLLKVAKALGVELIEFFDAPDAQHVEQTSSQSAAL